MATNYVYVCVCWILIASGRVVYTAEYCDTEHFNATCDPDGVIIITSAIYGRMSTGRCVTRNYGNIGCSMDVRDDLDKICSGRRQCQVPVISLHSKPPCPADLMFYLNASYKCLQVYTPEQTYCTSTGYVLIGGSVGRIGSPDAKFAGSTAIGYSNCPYRVSLKPYQKINFTLWDFSIPDWVGVLSSPEHADRHCKTLGYIVEQGQPYNSKFPICSGQRRKQLIKTTNFNTADVYFLPADDATPRPVVLEYSAFGCPPLVPPAGGHVSDDGQTGIVRCNETQEAWYLTCRDTTWVGTFSNCSEPSSFSRRGNGDSTSNELPSYPVGIAVVVCVGIVIGIIIGLLLLSMVLAYYRRQRNQEVTAHKSMYTLNPSDYGRHIEEPPYGHAQCRSLPISKRLCSFRKEPLGSDCMTDYSSTYQPHLHYSKSHDTLEEFLFSPSTEDEASESKSSYRRATLTRVPAVSKMANPDRARNCASACVWEAKIECPNTAGGAYTIAYTADNGAPTKQAGGNTVCGGPAYTRPDVVKGCSMCASEATTLLPKPPLEWENDHQ